MIINLALNINYNLVGSMIPMNLLRLSTSGGALRRSFHSSEILSRSSLKIKLGQLSKRDVLLKKTANDLKRIRERNYIKTKRKLKTAYSKQLALNKVKQYKLESALKDSGEVPNLGPTSDDNLQLLTKTNDKRLIYTVLGTTGEQLRDSVLVNNDVSKFIRRGQLEKALFLARFARHKGSAAMNTIMKYYLIDQQSPKSGFHIYNWRKKVDVPLNEYSNTILFSGLASQQNRLSKTIGQKLYNVVDKLIMDERLNQTEFNAALGALCNCEDISYVFKVFQRKSSIKNVRYDSISMLWILRALSRVKTDTLFTEMFNELVPYISKRNIDEKLLFELLRTLHKRDIDQLSMVIAVDKYYDTNFGQLLGETIKNASSKPRKLKLPERETLGIEKKFHLNNHIIGLLLNDTVKTKSYELGISVYEGIKKSNPKMIDIDMFHTYLDLLTKSRTPDYLDKQTMALKEAKDNGKKFVSVYTIGLMYKGFIKAATKARWNADPINTSELLKRCQNFVLEYDGKYSKQLGCQIYSRKSWLYMFQLVHNLNMKTGFTLELKEIVLDQLLKSLRAGEFDTSIITTHDYTSEIYIQLEAVRLLNSISEELKAPEDVSVATVKKNENFLRRRLLLRLKAKLINRVKELQIIKDENKPFELDEEEAWAIQQIATRILERRYGNDSSDDYLNLANKVKSVN